MKLPETVFIGLSLRDAKHLLMIMYSLMLNLRRDQDDDTEDFEMLSRNSDRLMIRIANTLRGDQDEN